ncbi:50S ribosomal protein L17 [Candidatus Peregrinibacteria bacterium CG2_30_44_17]|nr:MAG: 50S ribosomal protein L17 [Candidatus Peregrinibacteria bacterium CG2_30_44_17]
MLPKGRREALIRGLAQSLVLHEQIKTTEARAKVLKGFVDKLINHAKKEDKVSAIRSVNEHLYDKNAAKKLIEVIATRYTDKTSGYTKTIKAGCRAGDSAPMVIVKLT